MSKHTPGPWEESGLTVYDTCMDVVASVHSAADARLIAAAPDLLAALKPFAKHGNASCDYVEISSKHLRAAYRAYLDAFEVLWCETCGERPQEVRTEHAGLCHECWISEGRPE